MPTNKNAQLRYQILDRCFSDPLHKYTIDDLLKKVNERLYDLHGTGVSLRQVRADIEYMRDRVTYNAPIRAFQLEGRKCYYRYDKPGFSIFNTELSVDEIHELRSSIEMLGRFRGLPANAWLEEVISNLEYRFGIQPNKDHVVAFDQNEQLRGLEFLSAIIHAAVHHQPLQILYRTYAGRERTSIIHPYHVKQFNNRWFLFGLQQGNHGHYITNKALDRIVSCTVAQDVTFIPNTAIDFTTYFSDIVGVTLPEDHVETEEVVLRFDAARFPYIVSKPIHPSQRVIDESTRLLSIQVRPNKELEALIFSYGPQCEVLQPEWLREQIGKKMQEIAKKYASVQIGSTDNV